MRPAILLLSILLLAGCASPDTPSPSPSPSPDPTPGPSPGPEALAKGVSVSPRSYNETDFPRFFEEARAAGDVLLWGGHARELADETSAAHAIGHLARQHGFRFAAQVDYEGEDLGPAMDTLVAYVDIHEPAYMVLGVEIDRVAEENATFLETFAPWYAAAYDEVKRASPDTLVFPSFQLERMAGHTGGLYGGPASSEPRWGLLALFPERDLTAFTTYPGLVWKDPSEIPAAHYRDAAARAGGPVGFTEVGHFARIDDAPGWESSDEEQRAFVERFLADADAIDARLAIWLHLHDQPAFPVAPFRHMGLIGADGAPRAAHAAWSADV